WKIALTYSSRAAIDASATANCSSAAAITSGNSNKTPRRLDSAPVKIQPNVRTRRFSHKAFITEPKNVFDDAWISLQLVTVVVSVTILTTLFLFSQNISFSANWIWREVVDVFVMTPADGL